MRDRLFAGESIFAFQAFLLTIGFGLMQVGKGILAGHRQFARYGARPGLEGIIRLLAAVIFLALSASAVSLGWAMVAAPLGDLLRHDPGATIGRPSPESSRRRPAGSCLLTLRARQLPSFYWPEPRSR